MTTPHDSLFRYSIFLRDAIELGHVQYDQRDGTYLWTNASGGSIATGRTAKNPEKTSWSTTETITIARENGAKVGKIRVEYLSAFPIFSRISFYSLSDKMFAESNRFAFMGTRLTWRTPSPSSVSLRPPTVLGAAMRGVVNFLGRVFDVEIATAHDQVHPAFYLFSILQSHRLDVQISPIRFIARRIFGSFRITTTRR